MNTIIFESLDDGITITDHAQTHNLNKEEVRIEQYVLIFRVLFKEGLFILQAF